MKSVNFHDDDLPLQNVRLSSSSLDFEHITYILIDMKLHYYVY